MTQRVATRKSVDVYDAGMDDVSIARLIGGGRLAFGLVCLLAPQFMARLMVGAGDNNASGSVLFLVRIFGIRDAVLGAGALQSLASQEKDWSWVRLGAIADTADAVTALVARDELGARNVAATLAAAVPAAALGWKAALGLGRA